MDEEIPYSLYMYLQHWKSVISEDRELEITPTLFAPVWLNGMQADTPVSPP
jgi:hypothetical protein